MKYNIMKGCGVVNIKKLAEANVAKRRETDAVPSSTSFRVWRPWVVSALFCWGKAEPDKTSASASMM
jgi:hypothetical protein